MTLLLDDTISLFTLIGLQEALNGLKLGSALVRTYFLLLFSVIIWGWTFVATKICLAFMSPIELVGLRFLIGVPLIFAIIRFNHIPFEFTSGELRAVIIGSIIIAVHFLMQAIAMTYTTATNTSWIIATSPLALAILSVLILKEKVGNHQIAGIIAASFGVILLVSKGEFGSLGWLKSIGDWMILASANTWALYTIVTRDVSRSRNPLLVTLCVFLPVTVLCLLYLGVFYNFRHLSSLPAEPVIALLFLGILGTVTQWFWQIGVAKLGAARAGTFLYLEPVATTILAVPLLKEPFTVYAAAGGLMVTAGVWWAQMGSKS